MDKLPLRLGCTPTDPSGDPLQNDLPPPDKLGPKEDPPNPTNLVVPFLRNFKQINRQRSQVQKLRVKASEERRGPWKEARRQLAASGSEVLRVLRDLELPPDTREKLSSSVENLENAVKEVEKHDVEYDDVDGKLVPAEDSLKESERSLYVQMLGLDSQIQTETETYTAPLPLEMPWSPQEIDHGHGAEHPSPDLLVYGAGPGVAVHLKELGAAPEYPGNEHKSDIAMHDAGSARGASQENKPEDHAGLDGLAPAPSARSTSEAIPAEQQQRSAAGMQILHWSGQLSRVNTILAKIEAEFAVLQEEAERRMTVGVVLDNYSQQRLAAYPQHRGMLWKEIARIENEIASLQSLVGHGEANASKASEALFHLDQFNDVTIDDAPQDLHIDEDDDKDKDGSDLAAPNPNAEPFAPRTGEAWPTARNAEGFPAWWSRILTAVRANKHYVYASVTFWVLTCVQASWGSCLRFAHHNSLEPGKYTSNLALIQDYLFRKWFGPDAAEELPQYHVARSLHTSSLPTEDNGSWKGPSKHVTGSQWSTRPLNGKELPTRGSFTASPAPTRRTELLRTNRLNGGLRPSTLQQDGMSPPRDESMEDAGLATSRRNSPSRAGSLQLMPRPSSSGSGPSHVQSITSLQLASTS